ncbi:MAG: DinB family protein [Candidatus Cyclobacteriaceae bacterium M2_1C_046]
MISQNDNKLRDQLIKHVKGGEAFMPITEMLKKITFNKLGFKPDGLPYSFYQQFYHLRFAQYDILEFSRNPDYKGFSWPDDYWPEKTAPENEKEWDDLVTDYFKEREEFCSLLSDDKNDLFKPFPHGSGQTLLREALLIIEHSSYHTGQLLVILRLLKLH